jgi:hypothetical protein
MGQVAFMASPGAHSEPAMPTGASADDGFEVPPWITKNTYDGNLGFGQRALTSRTKLIIRLPDTLAWIRGRPPRDPNHGLPRPRGVPVPEEWQSDVPGCVVSAIPVITDVYAIGSNRGGRPVGHLPPVRVRAVAFGSIPVTVTLRLSQIIDGELVPLHADMWPLAGNSIPCDPSWGPNHPYAPAYVRGRLSVTLSELRIDGQPVDVGGRCRTVEPLQINMWADRAGETARPSDAPPDWEPGWTPAQGGDLYQREDTTLVDIPGGELVHPGSSDLTIPSFTGCVSAGGEDISPLLTASISGPGNQLSAAHRTYGGTTSGDVSLDNPTACAPDPQGGAPLCPLPAPEPPTIPVPAD